MCNETWMNDLDWSVREAVVFGLATGDLMTLDADVILPLATWATKTALVRTLSDSHEMGGWATPELFHALHDERRPPPHSMVQFGYCDQYVRTGGSNSYLDLVPKDSVGLPVTQHLNIVTWGLGKAYFQVALPVPGRAARAAAHRYLGVLPQLVGEDAVTLLWPGKEAERQLPVRSMPPRTASACGNPIRIFHGQPLDPSDFDA